MVGCVALPCVSFTPVATGNTTRERVATMSQAVTLTGNVTGAPELRYTPSGQAVVSFTVAVNERYRDQSGAWQDGDAYFQRVTAWGDLAEHVSASLYRGARAVVTGRLRSRKYDHTDKTTGEVTERYAHDLLADEVAASLRWNDVKIIRADRAAASTPAPAGADTTPDTVPDEWASEPATSK